MNPLVLDPELCRRVIIENVLPQVDGGRFPIKRCVGERVKVRATIHTDGTDRISALVRYRPSMQNNWEEIPLELINPGKDLWEAAFRIETLTDYQYVIQAWIDTYSTWREKLLKKAEADQEIDQDLKEGALLIQAVLHHTEGADRQRLGQAADQFRGESSLSQRIETARDKTLVLLMQRHSRRERSTYSSVLNVHVERERARYGAWYEFFPRSAGPTDQRSATFREAEERLENIARMGFDVVYLPPIHPIGKSFRKGPNNGVEAKPADPGSPWAIGSEEGGHKAIHPDLGTLEDFDHFVDTAAKLGLEVALDLAYQCSPDHPYVREHPDWFHRRPDGTIHYAENPPKKYEDIYPLDFECPDWQILWQELRDVVVFWIQHRVRIFRVDNPHTKPFRFWEWLIHSIQQEYPDVIFLGEAFTRPAIMENLAKLGFSQSYTYFTWRNTKKELIEYLTQLDKTDVREYFRPNFFVNTPDILHAFLQKGGRPAFQIRLILAATLAASYGIYGPPFELTETQAFPGTEDYVNSEKYQIRHWDWDQPGNLKSLVTQMNRIRHENAAFHFNSNIDFYPADNPQLLFYGKWTEDRTNQLLMIVNLDPHNVQSGWVQVPRQVFGLPDTYDVHDLLTDRHFQWHGESNFVLLNPHELPAHIFRVNGHVST